MSTSRKPVLLAVAAAVICLALPTWGAPQHLENERVTDMNAKLTLRKNGSLLVQEIIQVNVLGITLQNGIIREFPGTAQLPAPKLSVQEVKMDDQPVPFHVDQVGTTARIVVGEADQPLVTGLHTFILLYETNPIVAEQDGRDHFVWDVTGWNWDIPLDSVTATVELPKGLPPEELMVEGSTGGEGPRSKRYAFDFDTPGAVTFTAAGLQRNEGLAMTLDFPLGYIRHRSWGIPLVILEHSGIFVALLGLTSVALYWGVLWFIYGRTPKLIRQAPRTTPPSAVSAAGLRYLRQRTADPKALTVVLLSLARVGILRIEEADDTYTLRRTTADFHSLSPEERDVAKALFRDEESLILKTSPLRVKTAMSTLKKSLKRSYSKAFTPVRAFAWPALTVSALTMLASLYLEVRPFVNEQFLPGLILIVVFAVCVTLLHHVWPRSLKEWKYDTKEANLSGGVAGPNRPQMVTALLLCVMLLGVVVLLAVKVAVLWALLLAAQTAVNAFFMKIMQVPTPRGQRLLDELEGFRFHLRKLSSESAINSEEPELRYATFEQYLDFALAFDLDSEWVRRIDAPTDEPYRPDWYDGEHFADFYLRKSRTGLAGLPGLEAFGATGGM